MKNLSFILLPVLLSGCSGYKETTEDKLSNVSGCDISKVRIKGEEHPIYIAKCKGVVTTTSFYTTGGKAPTTVGVATVTVVQQEQEELSKKQAALEKLSDEEKKLLGLM